MGVGLLRNSEFSFVQTLRARGELDATTLLTRNGIARRSVSP